MATTALQLVPHEEGLILPDPRAEAEYFDAVRAGDLHPAVAVAATTASGWKVTQKRGRISGVGVSVSGAGAWAKMSGKFSFALQRLETSRTYQEMRSSYNISAGVSGFWSWIGFGANASTHKSEIHQAFHELRQSDTVGGTVEVDMMVSGLYPNVQVDASGYVLVLQITDDQGSSTNVFSSGAPGSDVGAEDQGGNKLPTQNNKSTITI